MDRLSQLTTALSDRYRIERELGAGGMATVYLAHDLRHDRPVAIKVLHPELAAALGGERFLSEIKTESGGKLMSVAVPAGPSFNAGTPRPLFSLTGYRRARNRPQYDVAPDGRFLMIRETGRSATHGVVYAEHWLAELLAKVNR